MPTARGKGGFISKGIDPVQAPNAPTIGSVSGGNASASVGATAPTDVGGASIDKYVARTSDGTVVATSVTPPIALSGLTNGQSYQFEVLAENVFGPSQYSATSASVTPAPTSIEDVFSTYLYDGTSATQTITNGIDLNGEGGLVWIKPRNYAENHKLVDTERGNTKEVESNTTSAESTRTNGITSFNSNGFTLGSSGSYNDASPAKTYVSWTFRKAPKFFDVVTYTGTGSARTVSHNLGSVPGTIIVKRTDSAGNWAFYHRSLTSANYTLLLNSTGAQDETGYFANTTPTNTEFSLSSNSVVNNSSGTYVAYLFAHNNGDGDFGPTGDQDIIKCGSVTMNSSGNASITLGFEPSWVLLKRTDSTGSWAILDTMRGWAFSGTAYLQPNNSNAEGNYGSTDVGEPTATGFEMKSWGANASYIYIAIRRGLMKTPTSGTDVFAIDIRTSSEGEGKYTSGFPVDWSLANNYDEAGNTFAGTRLTNAHLQTNSTTAESSSASDYEWDYNDGISIGASGAFFGSSKNIINYMFRRAPGFFDVVAYTGTGSATTISHNLGVVPEMIWVKGRTNTRDWGCYHSGQNGGVNPAEYYIRLNSTSENQTTNIWNDTAPTATQFSIGGAFDPETNESGTTYIAYLFATVAGVSKVGSYTGNGSSQTIDCGFSAGARFVLTKRINVAGNWNVFDSARGIVAGNDPRLELNTTDAEDTGHDYLDPNNSGFIVNYVADDNDDSNVSGDTYIFLAIA